jgi:hypothetical protein
VVWSTFVHFAVCVLAGGLAAESSERIKSQGERVVASHISRKTSAMWGSRQLRTGKGILLSLGFVRDDKVYGYCLFQTC